MDWSFAFNIESVVICVCDFVLSDSSGELADVEENETFSKLLISFALLSLVLMFICKSHFFFFWVDNLFQIQPRNK